MLLHEECIPAMTTGVDHEARHATIMCRMHRCGEELANAGACLPRITT
jgi:hypothetical protein